ncbi:glycoside hydrolase family 16 protein [Spirillospora sp. CA-142024]|uniref:glycoside hydrolase family 16 protein n=1 Tax=Spirillospora sp. CA-142024 TaxID=3240036 RepID=UPI003D8D8E71
MPFSFRRRTVVVALTTVTITVSAFAALREGPADFDPASDTQRIPPGETTVWDAPGRFEPPDGAGPSDGPGGPESIAPPTPEETGKPRTPSGGTTAAQRYGWGAPRAADEFNTTLDTKAWEVYDGPGHAGNGKRRPEAVTVKNGALRITGGPDGTTGGLGWHKGSQKLGRWEARLKLNRSCACYNANMLLWPVGGGGGTAPKGGGGEIDYMETYEDNGLRTGANFFLHYDQKEGSEQKGREGDSGRLDAHAKVDLTTWHTFAVEWTAKEINGYLDGRRWFHTTRRDAQPPGPMGQAIQLDWIPGLTDTTAPGIDKKGKAVLQVDWIRMYGP